MCFFDIIVLFVDFIDIYLFYVEKVEENKYDLVSWYFI